MLTAAAAKAIAATKNVASILPFMFEFIDRIETTNYIIGLRVIPIR
jgi:hypothetical protein